MSGEIVHVVEGCPPEETTSPGGCWTLTLSSADEEAGVAMRKDERVSQMI